MRPPGTTTILLAVACALCAAAIAAVPGPATRTPDSKASAEIVSALALAPQAVSSWEDTAKKQAAEAKAEAKAKAKKNTTNKEHATCPPSSAKPKIEPPDEAIVPPKTSGCSGSTTTGGTARSPKKAALPEVAGTVRDDDCGSLLAYEHLGDPAGPRWRPRWRRR